MAKSTDLEKAGVNFSRMLNTAVRLPLIRIDRAEYLRSALKKHCTPAQIEAAVLTTPAHAGIPLEVIEKAARSSIKYESTRVTGASAAAGLPGGVAAFITAPGDVVQFLGHVIRIAQKLAYLYSWPDLFTRDGEIDESTEGVLTLFIGIMYGVHVARGGVAKLAEMLAKNVVATLPNKALTNGVVYPIVKRVAASIGLTMTKRGFANGIAKAIPIAGAVVSGGLSLAAFLPMSKRLQKHLASYEHARPADPAAADGPAEVVEWEEAYATDVEVAHFEWEDAEEVDAHEH
ncbi:hypothetical protein ABYF34_06680 [Buchananella felis]|uniref:hypothetical protein n=1 Tax=Buchananella felis TaxID=3231492 RepID=UPI0035279EA1